MPAPSEREPKGFKKEVPMDRKLTIFFTSDIHGYFAPTDYANNTRAAAGLANCAANFTDDGNTLILDGGDTLQD